MLDDKAKMAPYPVISFSPSANQQSTSSNSFSHYRRQSSTTSTHPPPLWSCASARLGIAIALALSLAIEGLMRSNINMAMVCMVNKTALALIETTMDSTDEFLENINNNGSLLWKEKHFSGFLLAPAECLTHQTSTKANFNGNQLTNNNVSIADGELLLDDVEPQSQTGAGDLVISKQQQSFVFTSFYLGGLVIILPGSYLCDWLGPTRLVFYGALLNVIGTFITPVVVRDLGAIPLAVVRFVMGCGQGILIPCVNVLVSHWFPLAEKSTAIAISTTGNQISVIVAMFLTAELCVISWLGGWASAFYIYGIIGGLFCAIWLFLVTDYPFQSKRIGSAELLMIQEGRGIGMPLSGMPLAITNAADEQKKIEQTRRKRQSQQHRSLNPPWRRILSSPVVWSTGLCSFSQNYMNVAIVVYLPTYYQNVLGMDLTANGLMSALPFVIQLFTKILFAGCADWIKRRRLMSATTVTKLFNLIGSLGAGICFILLSLCDCTTPRLAIALAVTAVGISSGFIPGYNTSVVCIAPRYTSSIASFSRLLGQIASVASPYMIGIIVIKGTKGEWQFAFWLMAAILISTGLLFQFYGSASVQEWAMFVGSIESEALQMSGVCDKYNNGAAVECDIGDAFVPPKSGDEHEIGNDGKQRQQGLVVVVANKPQQ